MPDDLSWSSCNNNRNQVRNECNMLESFPNHPTLSVVKLSSTKLVSGAKKVGDHYFSDRTEHLPSWNRSFGGVDDVR